MPKEQLEAVLGKRGCERFMQHRERCKPETVWSYLAQKGVSYTYCQASDFPRRLTEIPDPPFGLFYKGKIPADNVPAVAMIGARKCSEYGRCMAEQFAAEFASRGINVISGMAMGIDGISQSAALKAGGSSYAVLGGGVDIVYPRTNETLYTHLVKQGGVLSEYPPQMEPRPSLFPPRNRIISALSDVVLVVEARGKSGTLITVDMALEQGREVYAIPGRCTDSLSMGCNSLLRQGAAVATVPEDIIEDMCWENILPKPTAGTASTKVLTEKLSTAAQEVYAVLDTLPSTQDEIVTKLRAQKSICTITQICQGLVELELKGFAVCHNGQYKSICVLY
ncbi:MAG: DNA-processing protein DprA [Lachnospiraceae bacterium]|nr:DNA-processing protein DprA [Lachnospiraceae bacterium]